MTKYDYLGSVKKDVLEYINDTWTRDLISEMDRDEFEEKLESDLYDEDSVTGNISGSYTMNAWEAEENLCHNLDLLLEAMECYYENLKEVLESPEVCDVIIRCYLLNQAITEVIDEEGYFD